MLHEERLLIGGELTAAEGDRTFETVNPTTGEVLGTAADASVGDTKRAIEQARRAFDTTSWSTDHAFRAHCLGQLHEALVRHQDELREVMSPRSAHRSRSRTARSSNLRPRWSTWSASPARPRWADGSWLPRATR